MQLLCSCESQKHFLTKLYHKFELISANSTLMLSLKLCVGFYFLYMAAINNSAFSWSSHYSSYVYLIPSSDYSGYINIKFKFHHDTCRITKASTEADCKYPRLCVTSTSLVECLKYLECSNKTLWNEGHKTRHMEKP